MPAIRVLVVDDERPARENLRVLLAPHPDVDVVGFCATGMEALGVLTADATVDVLFLDIRLPDMSGFDLLQALEADERPVVVFVTAFHEYAVRAFEANAIDYLVKPFSDERFSAALRRARRRVEERTVPATWRRIEMLLRETGLGAPQPPMRRLVIRADGRTEFVPVEEVDWIEAVNVYVRIHVGRHTHLIRRSMAELELRLDPREFVRIHRSTIVNLERIDAVERTGPAQDDVVLHDGTRLRLARARRRRLEEALGQRL